MGVRFKMKRKVRYISEIFLAIFLIFISYFVWNRIDVNAYEKYINQFDSNNIVLEMDSEISSIEYMSNSDNIKGSKLMVNNYQNKVFNADILLELTGVSEETINNLIISIDGEKYWLKDIYMSNNDNISYFLIRNIELLEYEKESIDLKLLVDDNYEFQEYEEISYALSKKIYG